MLPTPLLWFALALLLLALEWWGADFDGLLAGTVAALMLSLLSAAVPTLTAGPQLLLFTATTLLLLLALQRWSRRRARAIAFTDGAEQAIVISGFRAPDGLGRVRWQGQSWAAVNLEPRQPLSRGATVLVMGREGNRLQVLVRPATETLDPHS